MRYYVTSNDDDLRGQWTAKLADHGFEVLDEYDSSATIVTLGGDGTILYAARNYSEPTILPVRAGDSRGHKTTLETDQLVDALDRLEDGHLGEAYTLTEHRKLAAYRDGRELQGSFRAMNEINLHHVSPTLAAVFAVRIRDGRDRYEFERIIGDGVLVATPFGSTAYYRSITGGTFAEGLGVAFNNVHTPVDTPEYVMLSADGVVEVEMVDSEHRSSAVLVRDNATEMHELSAGEPVEIRQSDESVKLIDPLSSVD